MNRKLALALSAVTLALTPVIGCAATDGRTSVPTPAAQCQEDEACWDCHALGNRVCGPANDAERAYAWDVWEYANGAHSLKIDTTRGYRVDYRGNAIDYPRGLAWNEVALVGKDAKWYVFTATPTK